MPRCPDQLQLEPAELQTWPVLNMLLNNNIIESHVFKHVDHWMNDVKDAEFK